MSSPHTQPAATGELAMNVGVAQRDTGKHAVILAISTDLFSFQLALPPAAAEQLGGTLGPQIGKAAEEARRADTGLVVAANVPPMRGNNQ